MTANIDVSYGMRVVEYGVSMNLLSIKSKIYSSMATMTISKTMRAAGLAPPFFAPLLDAIPFMHSLWSRPLTHPI